MGLVRGPLGGDANARPFPVALEGLDAIVNEKTGLQLVDFANAAQAFAFPAVSISPPTVASAPMPLPVPVMSVFSSSLPAAIPCPQGLSVPVSPLLTLEPTPSNVTVANGLCQTAAGAYPLSPAPFTSPVACSTAPLSSGKAQALCGFMPTGQLQRVQPVLHAPTPVIRPTHPVAVADFSLSHPTPDISPRALPMLSQPQTLLQKLFKFLLHGISTNSGQQMRKLQRTLSSDSQNGRGPRAWVCLCE